MLFVDFLGLSGKRETHMHGQSCLQPVCFHDFLCIASGESVGAQFLCVKSNPIDEVKRTQFYTWQPCLAGCALKPNAAFKLVCAVEAFVCCTDEQIKAPAIS